MDTAELAMITGEATLPSTGAWPGSWDDGIVGRVRHGTAHLPSSRRY